MKYFVVWVTTRVAVPSPEMWAPADPVGFEGRITNSVLDILSLQYLVDIQDGRN